MLGAFRVLDLTSGGASLAGQMLADLGADVVLIEPPGGVPERSPSSGRPSSPDGDLGALEVREAVEVGGTERAALNVEPKRLSVVRVRRSTSLESFARSQGATVPVETLALINHIAPDARLESGRTYKVVTGGRMP